MSAGSMAEVEIATLSSRWRSMAVSTSRHPEREPVCEEVGSLSSKSELLAASEAMVPPVELR